MARYLPDTYTEKALAILGEDGITTTSAVVRNVRSGVSRNNKVLNVLVKIARENKKIEDETLSLIDSQYDANDES